MQTEHIEIPNYDIENQNICPEMIKSELKRGKTTKHI